MKYFKNIGINQVNNVKVYGKDLRSYKRIRIFFGIIIYKLGKILIRFMLKLIDNVGLIQIYINYLISVKGVIIFFKYMFSLVKIMVVIG